MALSEVLIPILIIIVVMIISALPLYFAVRFLGGKTTIFTTLLVMFITGIVVSAVRYLFRTFGGIIAFVLMIWIYREIFRLKWWKAFVAWLLQFVFIAVFYVIAVVVAGLILGISLLSLL